MSGKRAPIVHGTANAYNYRKCRCSRCTQWSRDDHQLRRARPPGTHGSDGYSHGCRCPKCVSDQRVKAGADYHREQDLTLSNATRRYAVWTGAEMEIAARSDLTASQVAFMLNRTAAAVKTRRKLMQSHPKWMNIA